MTKHPRSGEWFLLQTVPGFRFRSLRIQQNHTASLQYFRNIIDDIRFGRPRPLSKVLGSHFQPKYKNLLNLIPFEQISYIDPTPIGAGSRGIIHQAVWLCPQKIDMWGVQEIDVALKSVTVQGPQNLERFMQEVR